MKSRVHLTFAKGLVFNEEEMSGLSCYYSPCMEIQHASLHKGQNMFCTNQMNRHFYQSPQVIGREKFVNRNKKISFIFFQTILQYIPPFGAFPMLEARILQHSTG